MPKVHHQAPAICTVRFVIVVVFGICTPKAIDRVSWQTPGKRLAELGGRLGLQTMQVLRNNNGKQKVK
ncbi:unnamed protein product [Ceratitis capitata]|uniref:(Mediterranean fruit fly) hypothetical protein n=1 Tax=Ceratitis capitata TaxID=7213 RepID=A0A811U5C0_CERCA|nr:unnamed protein product [Ceratitis capitata]